MQAHPCIACMGLIFSAQGLLVWMFPPLSSVCAGCYPPERGRADVPTCMCSRALCQWGQQLWRVLLSQQWWQPGHWLGGGRMTLWWAFDGGWGEGRVHGSVMSVVSE